MRIVAISASKIPSTAANSLQVMKACQALAQIGQQVWLLVPGGKTVPPADLLRLYGLQQAFPVQWLPGSPALRRYDFAWRALQQASRLGGELIYCWLIQAAVFALLMRRPVILEMHGPPEGRFGPLLFRLLIRLPGRRRLLFISRALQSMVEKRFGVVFSEQEAVIAPNGVDLERYQALPAPAEARRRLGLPERFTAVYSGHLYPGRGMGLLLELARRFPQAHFLWVGGNPPEVQFWKEQLRQQRLPNVELTGFIPNEQVAMYQAAGEILLMPYERVIAGSSGGNSAEYCSPMKMFEYMACRRAILASDLPVIREVLSERNAWLCPPEALQAWSAAFAQALADPQLRARLADQAWQDVQSYSWQARARKALAGWIEDGQSAASPEAER